MYPVTPTTSFHITLYKKVCVGDLRKCAKKSIPPRLTNVSPHMQLCRDLSESNRITHLSTKARKLKKYDRSTFAHAKSRVEDLPETTKTGPQSPARGRKLKWFA
ncbi:hypothetical protein BaRGS_00015523 [Batillaria attramentaria]|uniref:Uncharacterized protein n=1 Tax=Batillaria attramentaria TaxID=370345 RepID=A0ABD0L1I2_9CAEN